jgi:hypothetical protein
MSLFNSFLVNFDSPGHAKDGLGRVAVPELGDKSLTSNATDDKSLLGITQQFLRPVDRAAVNELQSPAGGGRSVNVKTEIAIVAPATGSAVVRHTLYVFELGPNR